MFKDFGRKLQRGVQRIVDHRLKATEQLSGGNLKVGFTVLLLRSANYNRSRLMADVKSLNFRFFIQFFGLLLNHFLQKF